MIYRNFKKLFSSIKEIIPNKQNKLTKQNKPVSESNYNHKILNGIKLANKIRKTLIDEIERINNISQYHKNSIPTLKIIFIGDKLDSQIYIDNKIRVCNKIGVKVILTRFDSNITEENIYKEIDTSNKDESIHGIIIQLPFPGHLSSTKLLERVDITKDVDCLNPNNIGLLIQNPLNNKTLIPPTAYAVLELLRLATIFDNNIINYMKDFKESPLDNHILDLSNKDVSVLGRGMTAGFPISLLLLKCHANLSVYHSKSGDVKHKVSNSDIIISAVGIRPNLIDEYYIKKDSIVIDVGMNIVCKEDKNEITGDIYFDNVINKVKFITPMPGGVGRITVLMLIRNVIKSWSKGVVVDTNLNLH